MALRGSSPTSEFDLHAAVNTSEENGVPHGALLNTFAEAVLGKDDAKLDTVRNAVVEASSDFREDLGLNQFGSAQNTPEARGAT